MDYNRSTVNEVPRYLWIEIHRDGMECFNMAAAFMEVTGAILLRYSNHLYSNSKSLQRAARARFALMSAEDESAGLRYLEWIVALYL